MNAQYIITIGFIILLIISIILYITNTYESVENFLTKTQKDSIQFKKRYKNFLKKTKNIDPGNKIDIPVFYINMDKSTDRNKHMIKQFNEYNVQDYTRIPAINGRVLDNMTDTTFTVNGDPTPYKLVNTSSTKEPAYIGCTLSHLYAAKMIVDKKLPYALVLEDDMHFGLVKTWKKPLSQIVSDYEDDILKESGDEFDILKISNLACNETKEKYVPLEKEITYLEA
jgi:hypothetical protein